MEDRTSQFAGTEKSKGSKDNPLVSIITPVLNGVTYLEECIQSVLNQSYPYIEQVFVDGGSTDGTLDMLASYKAKNIHGKSRRCLYLSATADRVFDHCLCDRCCIATSSDARFT